MSEASGSLTLDYTRLARSKTNREPVRRLINILAAEKIRFLVDLTFVSLHFAGLKSYFLAKISLNTAEFFNHSKNSYKESRI